MHLPPFRASGGAPTRHLLQFWVLLLLVPACYALATMPLMVVAVAVTLTFGLPFGIWLAVNVHSTRQFRARVARAIWFATGVSITCLGLVGLFAFSWALACATVAAYVVTVGLMTAWDGSHSGARPGSTPASTHGNPTMTSNGAEHAGVVVTLDKVRKMTDDELCHAWRRSFVALQHAGDVHLRALVVQTRQLLLDEVDARHPAGLRAWLSSGASAAGSPDRFIGETGSSSGHPEAA